MRLEHSADFQVGIEETDRVECRFYLGWVMGVIVDITRLMSVLHVMIVSLESALCASEGAHSQSYLLVTRATEQCYGYGSHSVLDVNQYRHAKVNVLYHTVRSDHIEADCSVHFPYESRIEIRTLASHDRTTAVRVNLYAFLDLRLHLDCPFEQQRSAFLYERSELGEALPHALHITIDVQMVGVG